MMEISLSLNILYFFDYNLIDYDPNDGFVKLLFTKIIQGLSDEQLISLFINSRDYDISKNNVSSFINEINSKNDFEIDEKTIRSGNVITGILKELKIKKSKTSPIYVLYQTFIENPDTSIQDKNLSNLYQSFVYNVNEQLNENIFYIGEFGFLNQNVTITLPKKLFKPIDKKDKAVTFNLKKLNYKIQFDYQKDTHFFIFELRGYKDSFNSDFKVKENYYNHFKSKEDIK